MSAELEILEPTIFELSRAGRRGFRIPEDAEIVWEREIVFMYSTDLDAWALTWVLRDPNVMQGQPVRAIISETMWANHHHDRRST